MYCGAFGRTAKSASTVVAELGTCAGYQHVRRNGCKPIRFTSALLLGLIFLFQRGKHEGFVKYFLRLRSNGKEKRAIFCNFHQPPSTLHIHSSDRERMWPEAHCHVRDFRAILTMLYFPSFLSLFSLHCSMKRLFSFDYIILFPWCSSAACITRPAYSLFLSLSLSPQLFPLLVTRNDKSLYISKTV